MCVPFFTVPTETVASGLGSVVYHGCDNGRENALKKNNLSHKKHASEHLNSSVVPNQSVAGACQVMVCTVCVCIKGRVGYVFVIFAEINFQS